MIRVGVFGGSFDPPHRAHYEIATLAIRQIPLDKLYLVPAFHALLSEQVPLTGADHRLAMVRLLAQQLPGSSVLTYELEQKRPVPTIETIEYLHDLEGGAQYYLLIGGDQAALFTRWEQWERLAELAQVICFHRAGSVPDERLRTRATFIDYSSDLTSTAVRESIRSDGLDDGVLSSAVAEYIDRVGLYK